MSDLPDISDILARKAEGRRDLAKLDFWEKVRRMEALRARVRFLKDLRENSKAARGGEAGSLACSRQIPKDAGS